MNRLGACVMVALAGGLGAQAAFAQDVSRYRNYMLESSLEAVIAESRARPADVKVVHQRPAIIHQLEWRAPYVNSDSQLADPVRDIAFTFFNEALYQIVVTYDRDRTDGLASSDLVASLTANYGAQVASAARSRPTAAHLESNVLAQWTDDASSLTLLRDAYSSTFQLILFSKTLSPRASDAIRQAKRLDAIEAPRRDLELRKKEAADESAAREKTRETNKAAFRP